MYQYRLSYGSYEVILFESQFQFLQEGHALSHYEKGLTKKLFSFDRTQINQVWSELKLWGLIGRICPVELVRIMCAHGCSLSQSDELGDRLTLKKSYYPINYYTNINQIEYEIVQSCLNIFLDGQTESVVQPFIFMDDRLFFGSFYVDLELDPDSSFPKFCQLLEKDMCLPQDSIRQVLSKLLFLGYPVIVTDGANESILAKYDTENKLLNGPGSQQTLLYVGNAKPIK